MGKSNFRIFNISRIYNDIKPSTLNSTEFWILCEKLNAGHFKEIHSSGFCEHYMIDLEVDNEKYHIETWDGDITVFERGEKYNV